MHKKITLGLLMDFYGHLLTKRQQRAMEYYCSEDFSLSEIAALEGISRQGVSDAIKRSEKVLLEMEEKLGLADKYMKTVILLNTKIDETADKKELALLKEVLAIWEGTDGV